MQINLLARRSGTITDMKLPALLCLAAIVLPLVPVGAQTPACRRVEKGDTHRLDIGIDRTGAYVRLETPEPRESTARNPVRVYAGDEIVVNDRSTGRFKVLAAFDGAATLTVPRPDSAGFLLQASDDPARFLAVVAAARGKFLVIESRDRPGEREYVAIYDFDGAAARALLACAEVNGK